MCFGPGEQRVRLAGSETNKPDFALQGKAVKDLWDEENVVPPLKVNERSFGGQDGLTHGERLLRQHNAEAFVAGQLEQ